MANNKTEGPKWKHIAGPHFYERDWGRISGTCVRIVKKDHLTKNPWCIELFDFEGSVTLRKAQAVAEAMVEAAEKVMAEQKEEK